MSTPSTATATLPHQPHHRLNYSTYRDPNPAYTHRPSHSQLASGHSRLPPSYNYSAVSNNNSTTYNAALPPISRVVAPIRTVSRQEYHDNSTPQSATQSMARNAPPQSQSKKRERSPDWNKFYANGLPKEVIVIHDSQSPQLRGGSAEPEKQESMARGQPATKKRKREDFYDPVYHVEAGPQNGVKKSNSSSNTISSDRTTSAIHTTAATSLGSQYSSSGSRPYAEDDVQPGQKRKRVATRQQIAAETKKKEQENKSVFSDYIPPRKPIVKATDINVKQVADTSQFKNSKIDDDDGHYIVSPDASLTPRYQVVKLLGQGTFGKVVKALDRSRPGQFVAIKVIRSVQKYRDASRIELRVLKTLSLNDVENRNRCIHLRDCFDFRGHICIVMDLLGQSVFDFLKANSFVPFPNSQIQSFARQLFTSVAFLHDLNLIHTDLKPENILLVKTPYQTFTYNRRIPSSSSQINRQAAQRRVLLDTEIRLIDFGSATFQDEYHSSIVSTRHYRAPEIILGLGWSFPCDIWSIGCILVEFFTGDALFQTHDNLEHLAMMEGVLNKKIDAHLIQAVNKAAGRSATGAASYFKRLKLDYPRPDTTRASRRFVKAMKTVPVSSRLSSRTFLPSGKGPVTRFPPLVDYYRLDPKKKDDDSHMLQQIIPQGPLFNRLFIDLLSKIFVYDPAERITAKEALQHPWFREVPNPDDGTEALKIRREREAQAARAR